MPPSRLPRHAAPAPKQRRATLVPTVLLASVGAALGGLALLPHGLPDVSVRAAAASSPIVLADPPELVPTKGNLAKLMPSPKPSHTAHRASRARRAAPPAQLYFRPDVGPLTSGFKWRWGRMHTGIDLAGPYGSPVRAVTDGTVIEADQESGYGNIIKIRHDDGTVTVYAHLESFVVTGGRVSAGEVIAHEGNTGHSTGPHLHFEVRINDVPIDPIPWLAKHGIII